MSAGAFTYELSRPAGALRQRAEGFRVSDGAARTMRWAGSGILGLMLLGLALFWHRLLNEPTSVLLYIIPVSTVGVMLWFLGWVSGYSNRLLAEMGTIRAELAEAQVERVALAELVQALRREVALTRTAVMDLHEWGQARLGELSQEYADRRRKGPLPDPKPNGNGAAAHGRDLEQLIDMAEFFNLGTEIERRRHEEEST